jgi:hypothetical protein
MKTKILVLALLGSGLALDHVTRFTVFSSMARQSVPAESPVDYSNSWYLTIKRFDSSYNTFEIKFVASKTARAGKAG